MLELTPEQVLNADDLYETQEADVVRYFITPEELRWLEFVSGRYEIASYIDSVLAVDVDPCGPTCVDLTAEGVREALDKDGTTPYASCLSRSTALARLFFWMC